MGGCSSYGAFPSEVNWSWGELRGPNLRNRHGDCLFPYHSPLLRFSASPCTSLSLSKKKVVRGLWTLGWWWWLWGVGGYGKHCLDAGGERVEGVSSERERERGGEGGGGDVQVSVPQIWPAVARLGHFSIQEGPIGALITQAPVAPSRARMERRGATPRAQSVPLPPGLCLSVTAPIVKTP